MPTDPTVFDGASVEAAIAPTRFARHLQHVVSTPSTNTLALEAAQRGSATGVWVADEQTAGRGRGNHSWHSAPGDGLYVSILVRPALPPSAALQLSLATAIATQRAIAQTAPLTPDIRWPNDLLLDGRKCGGILIETAVDPAGAAPTLRHAVIGIGLNLNHLHFPPDLAPLATSLRLATGAPAPLPREPFLAALLLALDDELTSLTTSPAATLLQRFEAASTWVRGKRVRVGPDAATPASYTGTTAGLTPDGFLLITGDDGRQHTVLSGGVRNLLPER